MNAITALDYHIAHAPAVPDWFKTEYRSQPKGPGLLLYWIKNRLKLNCKETEALELYRETEYWPEDTPADFIKKIERLKAQWKEEIEQYHSELNDYHSKRIIQWRIFYAEQILSETRTSDSVWDDDVSTDSSTTSDTDQNYTPKVDGLPF